MTQSTVSFTAGLGDAAQEDDAGFLNRLGWERGLSAPIREAAASGSVIAFVKAWQIHGPRPQPGTGRYAAAMQWSRAAFPEEPELESLLAAAAGTAPQSRRRPANKPTLSVSARVEPLVQAITIHPVRSHVPFALGISLELLATSSSGLNPQQFWRLWRWALQQLIANREDGGLDDPTVPRDIRLMESGEFHFLAGILYAGIAGAGDLLRDGRKTLARDLVENTDTDGTPHADLVERLPLWLAPLVRSTHMAERFQVRLWTQLQQELFQSVVERAIPLCHPDGRGVLASGPRLDPVPVLSAAAELCGLPEQGSVGSYLRSVKRIAAGKAPTRVRSDGVLTMPSNQSDFARFALLRSDWSVNADTVALAHHRPIPQLDVTAAGRALIHGDWSFRLQIGDAPVELAEEWNCVCWQSDPDADYIELQMVGPGNLRVERIVMLSRTWHLLLLADSISGVPNAEITYESELPLVAGMQARADVPTREIVLQSRGFRARACPLALPQDRVQGTAHDFSEVDGRLRLRQQVRSSGLFAPVLLDWAPERMRGESQWRTLTVTEDGRVVTPDVATGYRWRHGDLQLLIYRSLKRPEAARAILGHHTWNETVVARVDKRGEVDPFLMVES